MSACVWQLIRLLKFSFLYIIIKLRLRIASEEFMTITKHLVQLGSRIFLGNVCLKDKI